jgi:starvation-inducible DNA-binding protein
MFKTRNDLPEAVRKSAIGLLQPRLADASDLIMQAKQAHWNVKGPHFFSLHELFDKIAEDFEGYADDLAERIVQLGGVAEGTVQAVAKATSLPAYPVQASQGKEHIEALAASLAAFAKAVRQAIDAAAEAKDIDTADLFTEVSRGVDKWLWFVEAHQQTTA